MTRSEKNTSEEKKLTTINTYSAIGLQLIVIIVSIWNVYYAQKLLSKHDATQRFEQKKFDTYFRISESVGAVLAHDSINDDFKKDVNQFYKLYSGEALLIDDTTITQLLSDFRFLCRDYLNGRTSLSTFRNEGFVLGDSLRIAVKNITRKK